MTAAARPLRFLLCVVGVGAGNTTRNLAILKELETFGPCEILIAAQGKARELLEKRYKTLPLRDVTYSTTGEFSPFQIVRQNLGFPLQFFRNQERLREIMQDFRPDVVIADSDFYCLRPARQLGLRLVSINNAAVVVESIRRHGGLPRSCLFSYNVIERTDYWLQRTYPWRVLCPTVARCAGLARKFVQIPPMVRPDITPLPEPGNEVVVLTGGSGIDVQRMDLRGLRGEKLRLLGTPPSKVPPGALNVGFTLDVMEHFRHARVLVVQGGFSSISEAVALRIPTVVVPIQNHAEQWSNGKAVEQLGLGISARDATEAGEAVQRLLKEYDRYWEAGRRLRLRTDGHRLAARRLWAWASGRARAADPITPPEDAPDADP